MEHSELIILKNPVTHEHYWRCPKWLEKPDVAIFLKFIGEKALSLSLLNQFLVCTLSPQPSRLQHRARTHRRRYKCLEFKAPLKGMFRSSVLIKCQLCWYLRERYSVWWQRCYILNLEVPYKMSYRPDLEPEAPEKVKHSAPNKGIDDWWM